MSATGIIPLQPSAQVADRPCHNLDSNSEDVTFWTSYLLPRFEAYLSEAGSYTTEQQAAHLACLRAALLGLGPRPPHPHAISTLTYNGLPIELSINLSEDRSPTARFYMEPLSRATGTNADPFGEEAFVSSFRRLVPEMTSVDTEWFHYFSQVFGVNEQNEVTAARAQSRPDARLPKGFMGVDFAGGNRTLKCTFCPLQKFFAKGGGWNNLADVNKVVIDAMRHLPGITATMDQSLDILGQYLFQESSDDGKSDTKCQVCANGKRSKPFFNLVSVDCADPSTGRARVKLYTRIQCNAFACIRDAVTLGGRLQDEKTLEGLRRLRSVWHLLLNDPESEKNEEYCRPMNVKQMLQGIDINWEISGQLSAPETKVYVPVYMFHENDLEVNRNLSAIFNKLNWNEWAGGRYDRLLRKIA